MTLFLLNMKTYLMLVALVQLEMLVLHSVGGWCVGR